MTEELSTTEPAEKKPEVKIQTGSSNPVYGLGMIGAWVYYIGRATTTEEKVKGFFKGMVWPAFLVHELFTFLQKE